MKRLLCVLILLSLCLTALPLTAGAVTEIKEISMSVDYPEAGKTPPGTATWHGTGYSLHGIDWYDNTDGRFLEAGDKIQANHKYRVCLWIEADQGYVFSSANDYTPTVKAYVNGEAGLVSKAFEYIASAMVYVTYEFSAVPSKGWIYSVDLTITAPKEGEKPTYPRFDHTAYKSVTMIDLPEVKNGIVWMDAENNEYVSPDEAFMGGNQYKVNITIQQKSGYAFVKKPVARVNGQVASSSVDYGEVLFVNFTFPTLSHTHTPSEWCTTGAYHYKACTTCGDFLEQEDHYGVMATCMTDGLCAVCGFAYLPASEDYHNPDTGKWVGRSDWYHYHACMLCGAHCDIEDHRWSPTYLYQDKSGHAWICADCKNKSQIEPHKPGPAATESSPQTCKDCGYIIAPAKGHTHSLSKVPETAPTCTLDGCIAYYACTGCSDRFSDAEGKKPITDPASFVIRAIGHTASDVWGTDDDYHWQVCTACNQVMDGTKALHDMADGKCATCAFGAEAPTESESTEAPTETTTEAPTEATTQPTQSNHTQTNKRDEKGTPLWVLILIGVGAVGIGVGGGILLLQLMKKKR